MWSCWSMRGKPGRCQLCRPAGRRSGTRSGAGRNLLRRICACSRALWVGDGLLRKQRELRQRSSHRHRGRHMHTAALPPAAAVLSGPKPRPTVPIHVVLKQSQAARGQQRVARRMRTNVKRCRQRRHRRPSAVRGPSGPPATVPAAHTPCRRIATAITKKRWKASSLRY